MPDSSRQTYAKLKITFVTSDISTLIANYYSDLGPELGGEAATEDRRGRPFRASSLSQNPGLKPIGANLIAVRFVVPEGLHDSSPTPQSLRRDRRRWLRRRLCGVGLLSCVPPGQQPSPHRRGEEFKNFAPKVEEFGAAAISGTRKINLNTPLQSAWSRRHD